MSTRLERDPSTKMIAGVCAGLATYLQIDLAPVRAFFVAAAFLGGFGFLAYLILLIVMPLPGRPAPAGDMGEIGRDIGAAAAAAGERLQDALRPADAGADTNTSTDHRRSTAGLLLVALGLVFLVSNLGLFRVDGRVFWPAALILIGVWLLVRRSR